MTGIFRDIPTGTRAAELVKPLVGEKGVILLVPGDADRLVKDAPSTEDMSPVGGALGGVVGTTLGIGLGLVVPGVGAVTALGAAAAAVLGAGGGYAGWKLGEAADRESYEGAPIDEMYVYEDALRRGRTVLIALVDEEDQEDTVRKTIGDAGAESVDAARDQWWIGIRDAEKERYEKAGGDFSAEESAFRNGFQAALRGSPRGGAPNGDGSREAYDAEGLTDAYERGYDRGLEVRNARN